MKKYPLQERLWYLVFALISVVLAHMGFASLDAYVSPLLQILLSMGLGFTVYKLFVFAENRGRDNTLSLVIHQVIAALIPLLLIASTIMTIKSLWFNPSDTGWGQRFSYENAATGSSIIAIIATLILSSLQANIYWVNRKKTLKLDERQIRDRQKIFEDSYKIGTFLVVGATYYFVRTINNIPSIIDNYLGSVPGHLYWLPVNLCIALFATPLILAAWRTKVSNT